MAFTVLGNLALAASALAGEGRKPDRDAVVVSSTQFKDLELPEGITSFKDRI
jgi:hypothetical protein